MKKFDENVKITLVDGDRWLLEHTYLVDVTTTGKLPQYSRVNHYDDIEGLIVSLREIGDNLV